MSAKLELVEHLETHKNQIKLALPHDFSVDRLLRIVRTEISTNKDLKDCDKNSILGACIQIAQLGLIPDGKCAEAYLVPYGSKYSKQKTCQAQIGYRGLLKLTYNSGMVISVKPEVVKEKDEFEAVYGTRPDLIHKKSDEDSDIIKYYAVAHMTNGAKQFHVMTRDEVIKHRDKYSQSGKSANPKSYWNRSFDEMALKTVVRKLVKYLPCSVEDRRLNTAIALDETGELGLQENDKIIDVTPEQPEETTRTEEILNCVERENVNQDTGDLANEFFGNGE